MLRPCIRYDFWEVLSPPYRILLLNVHSGHQRVISIFEIQNLGFYIKMVFLLISVPVIHNLTCLFITTKDLKRKLN